MKISKKLSNESGLTLLEVLVAMLILSMSLLLLLNMAMVALDGNDWSSKTTIATQLIQEKLEQLRFATVLSTTTGSDNPVPGFSRSWVVTKPAGKDFLREVNIAIAWEDMRKNTRVDSLTTYIKTDSL